MTDRRTASELARTQTLILAGGHGERLHPLTVSRPKPAVSFGGKFRIIDFTLSNCFHAGLTDVSLLTQYKHEELHRYVRQGWSELWDSPTANERRPIVCLPPASGKRYRGTADAVFQNSEILRADSSENVLLLSGDHIYHMDYRELLRYHVETNADVTIATVEHPLKDASQFGVVEVDATFKVTGFQEKPARPRPLPARPSVALVSMGVYVFRKSVLLEALRASCETGLGNDFGHDIIPSLIHTARTYAYDFRDNVQDAPRYWRDIGTLDAYYQASMDLVQPDAPFDPYANECWPSQPTRHPAVTGRDVVTWLRSPNGSSHVLRTTLAPGVFIEEGAVVEDSVLMPGVRIGRGARLRRTVVEEGVHVAAGMESGFAADEDRLHHTVTESGVVVISRTSSITRPAEAVTFALPRATARRTPAMGATA